MGSQESDMTYWLTRPPPPPYLLCSVVPVSAVQWRESAIHINISLLSWASPNNHHPFPPIFIWISFPSAEMRINSGVLENACLWDKGHSSRNHRTTCSRVMGPTVLGEFIFSTTCFPGRIWRLSAWILTGCWLSLPSNPFLCGWF